MKRSILTLAACFSLISITIGCKNSEENTEENMNNIETAADTTSQMAGTSQQQSSKELEDTDLVDSGTYTGTAEIVDQQQKELYVRLGDTTIIELYFSNETQIMQKGEKASFEALKEGQRIEVQVQRNGDQLNPQKVTILE